MKYIVVVEGFKDSLVKSLQRLRKEQPVYADAKFLLVSSKNRSIIPGVLDVEKTDYTDRDLERIFKNYSQAIVGVVCRGDAYIQYLRKIRKYLPETVPVASGASLETSTNKRMMREAFQMYAPHITPRFLKVKDTSVSTIETVIEQVGFPLIIKPASLASSILIRKCNEISELSRYLRETMNSIASIYQQEGRSEEPELIVEEFLEGDFYSVDAYVMPDNMVHLTPLVGYLPADSLGIDDFFLYKRWTPVELTNHQLIDAQFVAEQAISALGLSASSAHIEMVLTKKGWRIIEVGPRIGRFRNLMYRHSFNIDHEYNDLLIHLGMSPDTNYDNKYLSVAYSIYPASEGILKAIHGLDVLCEYSDVVVYENVNRENIGKHVFHAKNGGHALAEVVVGGSDVGRVSSACESIESKLRVEVV